MTETSDVTGTSYQSPSTFLFVPNKLGAKSHETSDDTNTPGAYFRLGSYSDLEGHVTTRPLQEEFYPRQHIADVPPPPPPPPQPLAFRNMFGQHRAPPKPAAPTNNVVTMSPGTDKDGKPASGIMLACNGRLLIRSGEATYLHSTKQIHIDTEDKFTLKVAKTLDMTSGGNLTIAVGTKDAPMDMTVTVGGGQGTLTQTAKESKTRINGNDFKKITKDSFTYYECNIYTYKLGGLVDVNMGGRFAFWAGSQLAINMSIDVTIGFSPILFYFFKADIGIFKVDICERKIELKLGKIDTGVWNHKAAVVKTATTASKVDTTATKTEATGIDAQSGGVQTSVQGVVSTTSGPVNNISAITNNI